MQGLTELLQWLAATEPVDARYVQVRTRCKRDAPSRCMVRATTLLDRCTLFHTLRACLSCSSNVPSPAPPPRGFASTLAPELIDRCLKQAVMAEHAAAAEDHGIAIPSASRDLSLDLLLLQVSRESCYRYHMNPFPAGHYHGHTALCLLACLGKSNCWRSV